MYELQADFQAFLHDYHARRQQAALLDHLTGGEWMGLVQTEIDRVAALYGWPPQQARDFVTHQFDTWGHIARTVRSLDAVSLYLEQLREGVEMIGGDESSLPLPFNPTMIHFVGHPIWWTSDRRAVYLAAILVSKETLALRLRRQRPPFVSARKRALPTAHISAVGPVPTRCISAFQITAFAYVEPDEETLIARTMSWYPSQPQRVWFDGLSWKSGESTVHWSNVIVATAGSLAYLARHPLIRLDDPSVN